MRPCWIQTTELIASLALPPKNNGQRSAIVLRSSDGGSTMLVVLIRTGDPSGGGKTKYFSGIHFQRFYRQTKRDSSKMVFKTDVM